MKEAWFDTGTGRLAIGEPAIEQLMQEAGHMALPLAEVLLDPEFPYQKDEFSRPSARDFTSEDGIAVGRAIAQMLMETDGEPVLTDEIVRRANILGLMPDKNFVARRYGSLCKFGNLVDARITKPSQLFEEVDRPDLLRSIISAHEKHGAKGPITLAELQELHDAGIVPDYQYIHNRLGGVAKLNEYIGYPDVRSWDATDFIFYGARILKANGPNALTPRNFSTLAKLRFGPYPQAAMKRFGTWAKYKKLCQEERERQDNLEAARRAEIEKHFTRVDYGSNQPPDPALQRRVWASYQLAARCLPTSEPATLLKLSLIATPGVLVNEIYRYSNGTAPRRKIELAAVVLNISDELWPPPKPLRPPIIPRKGSAEAREDSEHEAASIAA